MDSGFYGFRTLAGKEIVIVDPDTDADHVGHYPLLVPTYAVRGRHGT
jgi:hypothetical protein